MTKTPLPFIDLASQQAQCRQAIDAAITRVLDNGQYILGSEVETCETALADFSGATHVIGCANGTDALSLTLMAWGIGVVAAQNNETQDDAPHAVIIPNFTYVATAGAVASIGATPFFADVDSRDFNIDAASLPRVIADAQRQGFCVKAIIGVDLFGQPCAADALAECTHAHGAKLLIDAAQSFGGRIYGNSVGVMGDATTTSFFPAKPLGCYGDGGAIFTNDTELAAAIISLRFHGRNAAGDLHTRIGINSRLDALQAAILCEKLKIFPAELEARQTIASRYDEAFRAMASGHLTSPHIGEAMTSAWAQYTLKVSSRAMRDRLRATLKEHGIPSMVYYEHMLSDQPAYRHFPMSGNGTPTAEALTGQVLSLPMHPYLTAEQQQGIILAIEKGIS